MLVVASSFLLSHGVLVDARDTAGRTAVHYCSERGHNAVLNRLLAAGFSPTTLDAAHWAPLHFACLGEWPMHESHSLITAALLQHGADVNASELSGLRPLHVCTDTPVARLLVAAGAELEAEDTAGRRAIHYASHENTIMLVQHGADVQPTDKSAHRQPQLEWCPPKGTAHRCRCVLLCCVQAETHTTAHVHGGRQDRVSHTIFRPTVSPSACEVTWWLMRAHLSHLISFLVVHGADINAVDNDGMTPLDWADSTERPDVAESEDQLRLWPLFDLFYNARLPIHLLCINAGQSDGGRV